jgi:hypothetical protein
MLLGQFIRLVAKKIFKGELFMKMLMQGSVGIENVSGEQREFLEKISLAVENDVKGKCVFQARPEGFFWIDDYVMPSKAFKIFEKEAPEGLYRGGAIIRVTSAYGILVVPDERYNWFKPFAGLANFNEGGDLRKAGMRELMEEAFVYSSDKKTRFVPAGCYSENENIRICSLDFTVEKVEVLREVELLGYEVNQTNRALEAVLGWDISDLTSGFSVSLEEKWWTGGHNGISVYALNSAGKLVGVYSGQQGFIEIPKFGIHETLLKYL